MHLKRREHLLSLWLYYDFLAISYFRRQTISKIKYVLWTAFDVSILKTDILIFCKKIMKQTFFVRSKFALLFLFRKSTDAKRQSFSRIMKNLKVYSVNHQLLQQMLPPILSIMWMWKMIRRVEVLIAPVKNLMNPIHFLMPKKNKRMKIILSRKSQKIWIITISQERILLIKISNFWYVVITFFWLFFMPLINLHDCKN